MRNILALTIAGALPLALGGCETTGEPQGGPSFTMVNTAGQTVANVRMWETPGGFTFRISASGLPHGIHGLHVHGTGRCDPPGFTSAGPHWNPTGREHGTQNPQGPHRGDLPNVVVAANGVLSESVSMPGASFASLLDADGAAIILHSGPDDYVTDPSGGPAGARIACGVISSAVPVAR